MTKPAEILEFWNSIGPKGWWIKDDKIDKQIADKFSKTHADARSSKYARWEAHPNSALALVIVLDQFSRNLFRGDAKSFAQDQMALEIALRAIKQNFDHSVRPALKSFFYMPFMHSEKIADQELCVQLMHADDDSDSVKHATIHRDIITRFGRFPHRNAILGRHTTPAEAKFLDSGGFSG